MRIAGDAPFPVGSQLRITVHGAKAGQPILEIQTEVAWIRRNPLPQFGQFTLGVSFRPAAQLGIADLLGRCREAITESRA